MGSRVGMKQLIDMLTVFELRFWMQMFQFCTHDSLLFCQSRLCRPLLGGSLGKCCPGGVEDGGWDPSVGWAPVGVSSSPRLEEKTRSNEGSFNIHSTLDIGRQLKRICEGCETQMTTDVYVQSFLQCKLHCINVEYKAVWLYRLQSGTSIFNECVEKQNRTHTPNFG